jgi:hypothetical protein
VGADADTGEGTTASEGCGEAEGVGAAAGAVEAGAGDGAAGADGAAEGEGAGDGAADGVAVSLLTVLTALRLAGVAGGLLSGLTSIDRNELPPGADEDVAPEPANSALKVLFFEAVLVTESTLMGHQSPFEPTLRPSTQIPGQFRES